MKQYLSKTSALLLTLLTTSCAIIDWVDPIYEETAGISKPGVADWVDSPGAPLGLLSNSAVIRSAILYPNAYNSFGPSVSIAYATDDEAAVHSLQSNQFTGLGSASLPIGSTISGMSASISSHGTFVALDVNDGSGNISAALYKVADFSGSWGQYPISNGANSSDSTVFSNNFVNLVSTNISANSNLRCDAQEAALPTNMNFASLPDYNGNQTKIIRYSANHAVVFFKNSINKLAGYYFDLASTCFSGKQTTAFTGHLASILITSYDVQVNPNTGKGLFAGIDSAFNPVLASLESSMPATSVVTNSVSTAGLPSSLTEIALAISDNIPYLAIYGAGTSYRLKVYTPQADTSWAQMGSDISPDAIVPGTLSIGFDDAGNPMVAFGDTTQSSRLRVKVYQ